MIVSNFGCAEIESVYVRSKSRGLHVLYLEQSMTEQAGLLCSELA